MDRFKRVAEAVWEVAPDITLITTSARPDLEGNDAEAAVREKLALPLEMTRFVQGRGKKLVFDCHSFVDQGKAVPGIGLFGRWINRLAAKPEDVSTAILEFNAGAFDFTRGLSHAMEMNAAYRAGDVIRGIGTPNLSQPWNVYQTDWKAVLWTQGNIYYTQDKVWFQPAYYVDQMIARSWVPEAVEVSVQGPDASLDVFAGRSEDGCRLALRVVNPTDAPLDARIYLAGFRPTDPIARIEELVGAPDDFNTLDQAEKIKPVGHDWQHDLWDSKTHYTFPAQSFTVIQFTGLHVKGVELMTIKIAAIVLVFAFAIGMPASAAVTPNSLFGDDMVLQRDMPVPIWGTARDGETVTVAFQGQTVSTTASGGKWMVRLKPLRAGGPFTMTLSGDNTLTLQNVLVGDVWVCSGQSNMERQLGPRPPQPLIDDWQKEADSADFPQIRQFGVAERGAAEPQTEVTGKWVVCSPQTAPNFTAVGFFFGRALFQSEHVPIGLLFSSVGGTPASAWTSREAMLGNPATQDILTNYDKALQDYKAAPPPAPGTKAPADPARKAPGRHFNAMIAPLMPYAIRGVIWYQGETDSGAARQYRSLFPLMISDWRRRWGEGDFPFLFVQVAPYRGTGPDIREAQLMTLGTSPNTAMVVTTDIGDADNIHPPHKQAVGARLALAAEALSYHEKREYSGPLFQAMTIQGNKAVLTFTHTTGGLVAQGGALKGFTIAGADKKFVPATAEIQGDKIVVHSDQVPSPVAVRYGWANVPDVNLFNGAGLPASPFRTDPD